MNRSILYHYTSLDAFHQIIRAGRIRATHYRHLSGDPQELQFGVTELLTAVKKHPVDELQREYKEYLVWFVEQFETEELQVYVASFSEQEDSYHHWCKYAPDGVAIGFCRERVVSGFPIDITRRCGGVRVDNPVRPDPGNRFVQCQYMHTLDLPALVAKRFFTPGSLPAIFAAPIPDSMFNPLLAASVYRTICSIKREDFVEDVECRCFHLNPDELDYPIKTDDKGLSFIEMQFDPVEFVKEVWVAPDACHQTCEPVVESLVDQGLLVCDVFRSRRTGSPMMPPSSSSPNGRSYYSDANSYDTDDKKGDGGFQ
ncbi:MAG: hypothetical protein EXR98_24115 [Gemmataceae bacterium]|nr:hypothetical protein [Gemmataceae bacterium]